MKKGLPKVSIGKKVYRSKERQPDLAQYINNSWSVQLK